MAQVAVIFSGCGHQDGSEIHEAVLLLLELSSQGHNYQCFAPNKLQACVINHLTNQKVEEKRNCLVEAARIARGQIRDIKELEVKDFDALIFPGGFGAAMNLCDFGLQGAACSVDLDVARIILAFFKAHKPIGATCIAPVILAKALEGVHSLTMTLGSNTKDEKMLEMMGIDKPCLSHAKMCIIDLKNRIYTTPCYMEQASIADIHQGIKKLIQSMFEGL